MAELEKQSRSIDTLLKLERFDDLTNEEVSKLIDYHYEQGFHKGKHETLNEQAIALQNEMLKSTENARISAEQDFQNAINLIPAFGGVELSHV